jgi:hypothetical protein
MELGTSAPPGTDASRLPTWKDGVRQIMQHFLAQGNQADANAIAATLMEYRRQFSQDPSRILDLGDDV